jgi:hypothetical protein
MSEDLGAQLNAQLAEQKHEQEVQASPEFMLVRYIKASIHRGEQATERAAQNQKKSQDHFIAAGKYLAELKRLYAPTWEAWETILKTKVGISTSRASELMQVADGRKNVEQVRTSTAQRVMRHAKAASSLAGRPNEERTAVASPNPHAIASPRNSQQEAPTRPLVIKPGRKMLRRHALMALDFLLSPDIREAAFNLVIAGERQSQFQAIADAVGDLYRRLAGAGR